MTQVVKYIVDLNEKKAGPIKALVWEGIYPKPSYFVTEDKSGEMSLV